ncbi:MAG: hypothetical protein H6837_13260 [Planctomycetes bacterium]|nr:hypothetical protein [Planctomycetota bacterium]
MRWRINNSTVELVSSESKLAGGRMCYKQCLVNDIVEGVPSKPGIEPKLSLPGDEAAAPPEEAEAKPTIVDAGKLQELIRANIGGDSWDSGGATISELRGSIIVRHTRQVHKQIDKLLADLREAVGIQVDVESRFLQVTDNFLEDVGVDFRGLGNNSAEGVPGRGIANRPNVGFDDFGRRENINPASPGTVGTGTEPGAFFDDGGDGDFFGRTENLFDSSLNGDAERDLTNAGGLSLQWAY